jgi:hypothetical protein
MQKLQTAQLGYIAGIMDGEGCISLARQRKNYHYSWQYCPHCNVGNTNLELLHWLHDSTRLGNINPKLTRGINSKPAWTWELRVYEIRTFLQDIMPYLIIKKRQSEIIIEFITNSRHVGVQYPLTEHEKEYKNRLFIEMSVLNERGL